MGVDVKKSPKDVQAETKKQSPKRKPKTKEELKVFQREMKQELEEQTDIAIKVGLEESTTIALDEQEELMIKYNLSDREFYFGIYYSIHKNATRAYKQAFDEGCSDDIANRRGFLMKRKDGVSALCKYLMNDRINRAIKGVNASKKYIVGNVLWQAEDLRENLMREDLSDAARTSFHREFSKVNEHLGKIEGIYPQETLIIPERSEDTIGKKIAVFNPAYVRDLINRGQVGLTIKQTEMSLTSEGTQTQKQTEVKFTPTGQVVIDEE